MINNSLPALTRRYVFALSLIALLLITSYLTLQQLIKQEEKSAVVINLSGRQRMLSQKAALLGIRLINSNYSSERQELRSELLKTVDLMEKTYTGLIQGDNSLSLPGKPSLRKVARYGGEEFVVVLPNTDKAGSAILAEELRFRVEALKIPHVNSKICNYVTLSLGFATIVPNNDALPDALISEADQALYQAKEEGRNRVKGYQ